LSGLSNQSRLPDEGNRQAHDPERIPDDFAAIAVHDQAKPKDHARDPKITPSTQ
jgi:hypothetical protein